MRTRPSIRFLLLALPMLALFACSDRDPVDADGTLVEARPHYVVGIDRDFPPYSFVDSNGRIDGFTVELTRAVAELMDFEVELRAGTSDEIVAALENGEIDIIPHLSPTAALEEKIAFALSHLEVPDALFVRADTTDVLTVAHIHDHPCLVWQVGAVEEFVRRNMTGEILYESSIPEALRRLAGGEAD